MDPIIPYVTIKRRKKKKEKETGANSANNIVEITVVETSGWRTIGGKKITPSQR